MDKTYIKAMLAQMGACLLDGRTEDALVIWEELYTAVRDGQLVPGEHEPTQESIRCILLVQSHLAQLAQLSR